MDCSSAAVMTAEAHRAVKWTVRDVSMAAPCVRWAGSMAGGRTLGCRRRANGSNDCGHRLPMGQGVERVLTLDIRTQGRDGRSVRADRRRRRAAHGLLYSLPRKGATMDAQ